MMVSKMNNNKTYVIKLKLEGFPTDKEFNNFEKQLIHDTCKALDGLEWEYKTLKGVSSRLSASVGYHSNINLNSKNNQLTIGHKIYGGKRKIKKALPGMCSGAFSINHIIDLLKRNRKVKLPFTYFYDTRAISKDLQLDKCFIKIFIK